MPRILAILVLLATPVLAQTRQPFPDDYVPSPCATAAPVCKTFRQSQFHDIAALRGFDIGQEWIDAHWAELTEAVAPACAKIATCFAANPDFTFCNDVVTDEVYATTCDRYPKDSTDHEKCQMFIRTFFAGHDRLSREPWQKINDCAKAQAAPGERTFEWWMVPEKIGPGYDGSFWIYAIDSETRVPVMANIVMDVKPKLYATEVPSGQPTTFYRIPWKPKLVRVPNDEGHRDVVAPEVRLEAPGYKPVTFRMPMEIPTMKLTMDPEPSKLKRGKNTVTITAVDAATGEPVEARVMGNDRVLGKTNVPFELELEKGEKRPEIWVTSLYDRYDDVVVAPAEP